MLCAVLLPASFSVSLILLLGFPYFIGDFLFAVSLLRFMFLLHFLSAFFLLVFVLLSENIIFV